MEFNELQKIWDQQNQQTLYAIDERNLHLQIKKRLARSNFQLSTTEIGYILISLICSTILLLIGSGRIFNYVVIAMLLLIAVLIGFFRLKRLKVARAFDQSLSGKIEAALANQRYFKRAMDTFLFWYILPLSIPALLNMSQAGQVNIWQWAVVIGSFILGYFVVRQSALPGIQREIHRLEQIKSMMNE